MSVYPRRVKVIGLLWLVMATCLGACGSATNTGAVSYFLAREATASLENTLHLEIQGSFRPRFSLTGEGFTADVPLDTVVDAREVTKLRALEFGVVDIRLTLYQEHDQAYLDDTLRWMSNPSVPGIPDVTFSEDASADAWVYLVLSQARGPFVNEVWVEGDLAERGRFHTIPADDQVLIQLSEGDGLKNLKVHYRNMFGTEGAAAELGIVRKSVPPTQCQAIPEAAKTSSGVIRTRIQAENQGPLFFKVEGDVRTALAFRSFVDRTDEWIELSPGEGQKNLKVRIQDAAGNRCPDILLTVEHDSDFRPGSLRLENDRIWTDDPLVTLLPAFEHLEGDNITMFISGGVVDDDKTFAWIPYQERIDVSLTPSHGTRHIIVQFRRDNTLMSEVSTPVYLRPYLWIVGSGAVVELIPSQILGAHSLSIVGCSEVYQQVPYAASFACTKAGSQASITYHLQDGSAVTRSVPF